MARSRVRSECRRGTNSPARDRDRCRPKRSSEQTVGRPTRRASAGLPRSDARSTSLSRSSSPTSACGARPQPMSMDGTRTRKQRRCDNHHSVVNSSTERAMIAQPSCADEHRTTATVTTRRPCGCPPLARSTNSKRTSRSLSRLSSHLCRRSFLPWPSGTRHPLVRWLRVPAPANMGVVRADVMHEADIFPSSAPTAAPASDRAAPASVVPRMSRGRRRCTCLARTAGLRRRSRSRTVRRRALRQVAT